MGPILWLLAPAVLAGSPVRLGAELVLPGDVDGDGWADLAYTCGDQVCVRSRDRILRVPSRLAATDPRVASVLPAGDGDADGRAELWIDGVLRQIDAPTPRARLAHPPIAGGFDANQDGATDVLVALPGGRVILLLGPFSGEVEVDPDAPNFPTERAVVYEVGVDGRVAWLPDLLGPGRGAVAVQCPADGAVATCPTRHRTTWWPVPEPGRRLRPEDRVGGLDASWVFGAGDLDGDGRGALLADDGRGDWARVRDGVVGAFVAPGGPVATADLDGDGRLELVHRAPGGATVRHARGCIPLDAGFEADQVVAGMFADQPHVVVAGRGADGWALVWFPADDIFGAASSGEVTPCGG